MPVPPDPLVQPGQLSRFGVPSAFLSQFALKTFQIQIATAGALGMMQWIWQYPGDPGWSAPIVSPAVSSWSYTLDDTFSDLVFSAATYVLGKTYTVDENGVVTGGTEITATRFDLRVNGCSAVTSEAMTRMRDAIRPPLTTWGDDARAHASSMVYAFLKRASGATPPGAGEGDAVIFAAEESAKKFFDMIGMQGRPDSMTDSSPSVDGPLIAAYPGGDTPRGW